MPKEEVKSPSSIKQFFMPALVVIAILLAVFVGSLWQKVKDLEKGGTATTGTQQAAAPAAVPTVSLDTVKGLFSKDLIKFGDVSRKVLFVEIADPSCPFCHVAGGFDAVVAASMDTQTNRFQYVSQGGKYAPPVPEMKKLVDAGQASYVYIYYPGHGNGQMGMKALYCANEQGKFWAAHDLIMSNSGYILMNTTVQNDKTKSQVVANFFKSIVDPVFMKSCLDNGKYDARLTSDAALGQDLSQYFGQNFGTPAFFVNTNAFGGAYSWTDMKTTVDTALK